FKAVPIVFQLTLGAQPSGLAGITLLLNKFLELVALLVQVRDELVSLHSGIGLHVVSFGFERRQYGIHFVDPLFGPIEIEMHTALRGMIASMLTNTHQDLLDNLRTLLL